MTKVKRIFMIDNKKNTYIEGESEQNHNNT